MKNNDQIIPPQSLSSNIKSRPAIYPSTYLPTISKTKKKAKKNKPIYLTKLHVNAPSMLSMFPSCPPKLKQGQFPTPHKQHKHCLRMHRARAAGWIQSSVCFSFHFISGRGDVTRQGKETKRNETSRLHLHCMGREAKGLNRMEGVGGGVYIKTSTYHLIFFIQTN